MIITGLRRSATVPVARGEVNVAVGSDGYGANSAEDMFEQWALRANVPARRQRIEIDPAELLAPKTADEQRVAPAFRRRSPRHRESRRGDGRRPHRERGNRPAELWESGHRGPTVIAAPYDRVDFIGVAPVVLVRESTGSVIGREQLAAHAPRQPL